MAMIYLMSGLSKLRDSGLDWFRGDNIEQKLVRDALEPIFLDYKWKATIWLVQHHAPGLRLLHYWNCRPHRRAGLFYRSVLTDRPDRPARNYVRRALGHSPVSAHPVSRSAHLAVHLSGCRSVRDFLVSSLLRK